MNLAQTPKPFFPPMLSRSVSEPTFSGVIIDRKDIVFVSFIKNGSGGCVYKGRVGETEVAVKETSFQSWSEEELEKAQKNLKKEVQILSDVHHENICLFLGARIDIESNNIILVSELCTMDLEEYMYKIKDVFDRVELSRDICKGMAWLHDVCGIVHHDLKPANLLVKHGRLKITDFGFSQILPTNKFTREGAKKEKGEIGGTPRYMAPERFGEGPVEGIPGDIYSFGIILWEMITLKSPFTDYTNMQSFIKGVISGDRPDLSLVRETKLQDLLKRCWSSNPKNRPSFRTILQRIDTALVSQAISDPAAQHMWMNMFSNSSPTHMTSGSSLLVQIPWLQFAAGLQGILNPILNARGCPSIDIVRSGIPDPNQWITELSPLCTLSQLQQATDSALQEFALKKGTCEYRAQEELHRREIISRVYALKKTLCDDKDIVHIKRFGKLVNTLGWGLSPNGSGLGVLDDLFHLCQQKWFHPWVSKEGAYTILKQAPNNTIVCRFSSSGNHVAVSMVIPNQDLKKPKSVIHLLLNHHHIKGWSRPQTREWKPTIQDLLAKDLPPEQVSNAYFDMKEVWDSNVGVDEEYQYHKSSSSSEDSETYSIKYQTQRYLNRVPDFEIRNYYYLLQNEKKEILSKLLTDSNLSPKEEDELLTELGRKVVRLAMIGATDTASFK